MEAEFQRLKSFLKTDTARLMLTYLGIIMAMSLSFSIVQYATSASQLERQRPPQTGFEGFSQPAPLGFRTFIDQRIEEGKREIFGKLIVINFLVLIGGGFASYYLARRSLRPIEEAMEAQSQFVSDASHELRTPLTALRTTNEVALRRGELTLKQAKETIQENLDEVERLQQLTDGLLRLSTQDSSLRLTEVHLEQVIDTALASVATKASDKQISVDNQIAELQLIADEGALTQIMTILLDNAIKYSPDGTTITLTAARGEHDETYIHVTDQGIGIKPEALRHIFTRFYRADESRSETSGYGLGLPIAHKLTEAHSGSLAVESVEGEGSTFTLNLPSLKIDKSSN